MKFNDLINWVKASRENCEKTINCAGQKGNLKAWTFYKGNEDVENMLTKVEQELTVKKLQDFCLSHSIDERTINCEECPFFDAGNPEGEGESWSMPCCEIEMYAPNLWNISSIEKTIKEATTE
jgi:hypothetical protein